MHLKAAHSGAAFKVRALHLLQRLSARQHGLDVEQAEPVGGSTRGPLDALGIADAAAEHLIAAAESEHAPAAAQVRSEVDVPALLAQEGEVGQRRLGAGQDDEIGIAGQRTPGPDKIDRSEEEHTSELQSLMRNTYAVFCLKI